MSPKITRAISLLLWLTALPACKEKEDLRQQLTAQVALLAEKKSELGELRQKLASTPSATNSPVPRPTEIYDLQNQMKSLDQEIQRLQEKKAALKNSNEALKQDTASYLRRYTNL